MSDQDILVSIRRLLDGDVSLDQFEDKFLTEAWDSSSQLATAVIGILAESSGRDADATAIDELRELISPNITNVRSIVIGAVDLGWVVRGGTPTYGHSASGVSVRGAAPRTGRGSNASTTRAVAI